MRRSAWLHASVRALNTPATPPAAEKTTFFHNGSVAAARTLSIVLVG